MTQYPQGIARGWWIAGAVLLAALTLYLGFSSGGYYPGATGLAAAEMAVVVAAWALLARRPLDGLGIPLAIAVAALGAFAAWILLSANWSDSMARALPDYTRALLYGLTLLFFGLLPFDTRRIRWMLYAFALAVVAICMAGLIARLLPEVIHDPALREKERLGYPLTYWNSLGLLAGIGIVLCGHLACSTREPRAIRVVGSAAVPLLTLTLYYTLSRGASWATIGAVVVYVLVGRPRGLLSGAVATAPATAIALMVANPPDALTEGALTSPTAVAAGKHVATVLGACMVGAAVVRILLLRLDRRVDEWRLLDGRPRVAVALAVTAAALAVASGVALGAPGIAKQKYEQFTSQSKGSTGEGGSRLLSADTNGRQDHWEVALAEFRDNELRGSGAGTYALVWARERPNSVHVDDAHSLYLQTLGELGLVGFALLVVVLVLIVGAFAWRSRGPDRALFAALLAAALGWAVATGVDWDWEMPATTVWLFAFGGAALARSRPGSPNGAGRSRLLGWAARLAAAVACLALAVTPARVAIAAGRFDEALAAFRAGDCPQAKRHAGEALSAEPQRAAPYELIAFCDMREGRYRRAVVAMQGARRHDPHSWEVFYGLAVARAAAGLDPRAAAARAARLDPRSPHALSAKALFGPGDRDNWVRAGRDAPLLPPAAGDP